LNGSGADKVTGWYTDPNGVTVNVYNSHGGLIETFNVASNAEAKRALITQKIDESQLTTLAGNTRPEVNALNDRGPSFRRSSVRPPVATTQAGTRTG